MSRIEEVTWTCQHWSKKEDSIFECSNSKVERQIGDDQGTNEQHNLATCRMQNKLKEFEELLLDNTLFKVQNQVVGDINPKWKEWW